MAKRKGSSGSGADQYIVTAANLVRKGKTNKKLKSNMKAKTYLSAKGQELKDAAVTVMKEHPAGTGYKFRSKKVN